MEPSVEISTFVTYFKGFPSQSHKNLIFAYKLYACLIEGLIEGHTMDPLMGSHLGPLQEMKFFDPKYIWTQNFSKLKNSETNIFTILPLQNPTFMSP